MKIFFLLVAILVSFKSMASSEQQQHHHVAIFTGATESHKVAYGTLGLEYQYLFDDVWGLGAVVETIKTQPNTEVGIVFISFRLVDHLYLVAGLGQEKISGHSEGISRIGMNYAFHFGNYSIAPSLEYDTTSSGHASAVYGLLWGFRISS